MPESQALCGDGVIDDGESCDDGNTVFGDGCSATCLAEPYFTCRTPGEPCVHNEDYGDGRLGEAEHCDDGNTASGDGCSGDCQIEVGWTCSMVLDVGHSSCDPRKFRGAGRLRLCCVQERTGPSRDSQDYVPRT